MNKILTTAFLAVFGLGAMSANADTICNTPIQGKKFYVNKKPIAGYPAGVQHPAGAQCVYMKNADGGVWHHIQTEFFIREEGERCSDVYEPTYFLRGTRLVGGDDFSNSSCEAIFKRWNKNAIRFVTQYKEDDGSPYMPGQSTEAFGCVAVAKGDDGKDYPGVSRDSEEDAKNSALLECREKTDNCEIAFSRCG